MVVVPPMTKFFIGSTKYATCKGGSSNTYSFGQIVSGGTLKAVITNPSTENVTVELYQFLFGWLYGTETNVTFKWNLTDPNGVSATISTLTPTN
jgi:hypothetical protein